MYYNYAALLPNGKIICIESDWWYDTAKVFPTRLNADGSLDSSLFDKIAIDNITALEVTQDGKILIGGVNNNDDMTCRKYYLKCLDLDFTVSNSIINNIYFDNYINNIIVQPNGNIIVVGDFCSYNSLSTPGICRIQLDGH